MKFNTNSIRCVLAGDDDPEENSLTAEDIAEVLSMWTGIPIYQFTEEESSRLLRMEEEMRKHIVGQEDAITAFLKLSVAHGPG